MLGSYHPSKPPKPQPPTDVFKLAESSKWQEVVDYLKQYPAKVKEVLTKRVRLSDDGAAFTLLEHVITEEDRTNVEKLMSVYVAHHIHAHCSDETFIAYIIQSFPDDYVEWIISNNLISMSQPLSANLQLTQMPSLNPTVRDLVVEHKGVETANRFQQWQEKNLPQANAYQPNTQQANSQQVSLENVLSSLNLNQTTPTVLMSGSLQRSQSGSDIDSLVHSPVTPVSLSLQSSMQNSAQNSHNTSPISTSNSLLSMFNKQ